MAGILSPVTFGFLLDKTGSWVVPFGLSAALLLVGALAATRVKPRPIDVPVEEEVVTTDLGAGLEPA